jgi:hypothetical protein
MGDMVWGEQVGSGDLPHPMPLPAPVMRTTLSLKEGGMVLVYFGERRRGSLSMVYLSVTSQSAWFRSMGKWGKSGMFLHDSCC